MPEFPIDILIPAEGSISVESNVLSLEVPLATFELFGEQIDTSLFLDGITLPASDISVLVGSTFDFPTNPDDGYIDASVYIAHAHHPIDVVQISIAERRDGLVRMELKMKILFEFEGLHDFQNTDLTLSVWAANTR